MDLHPLAHGFEDVADVYERGRPDYPADAIAAIGLPAGARVADVGAGTGKLTRALLAAGLEVVAVEPFAAMRAALPDGIEVLAGTAEALPLADASVDAVACGDSFHWFDGARAAPELARVIRPGGVLALLWNVTAGEAAAEGLPWAKELIDLLNANRPEHPGFTEDQGRDAIDVCDAFGPFTHVEVAHVQHSTRAMIVSNVASISYVAVLPDAERRALLARVDALLGKHGVEALDVPLRTGIWTARRL
jgi:SAM-dependent methyltransferase